MKRKWIAMLLVVCLCLGNILPTNASDTIVNIPDKNLKSALTASGPGSIDRNDDGEISKSEITGLTYLYMNGGTSNTELDLTGLEYATNLGNINISGYVVNSLAPLKGSNKLTTLSVKCKDVSALSELTNLQSIVLKDSEITEIPSFDGMKNLNSIDLSNNKISDITNLLGFEGTARLEGNPIEDIQPLKNFKGRIYLSSSNVVNWESLFATYEFKTRDYSMIEGNRIYQSVEPFTTSFYIDGEQLGSGNFEFEIVDPDVAQIEGSMIKANTVGTTDFFVKYGNVSKRFTLRVFAKEKEVSEVPLGNVSINKMKGEVCELLDEKGTLWSINTGKVEKAFTNVKDYVGVLVYENNVRYSPIMWGDYYVLDEANCLWKTSKSNYDDEYKSTKWFDNVRTFDKDYTLLENGELYNTQTKEKAAENIKKYYRFYEIYGQLDFGITRDDKFIDIKSGEVYFANVDDVAVQRMSQSDRKCAVLNGDILTIYDFSYDYSSGTTTREEVNCISGVKEIIDSYFFVKENGSIWRWSYWNDEVVKVADSKPLYLSTSYLLDSQHVLWRYNSETMLYDVEVMRNVQMFEEGEYIHSVIQNDGSLLLCYWASGSNAWEIISDNVHSYYGDYYLTQDGILREIESGEDDFVLSDVVAFSCYEDFRGTVYALRQDGSVWVYDSTGNYCVPREVKEPIYCKGDISDDGEVTIKDVQMIFSHISGATVLTDAQFQLADVNGDGKVTANDMQRIFYYVNGKIDEL